MVFGVLLLSIGAGLAAGFAAALATLGGLLVALSLLVGWRT
jgi:hypothetical protein